MTPDQGYTVGSQGIQSGGPQVRAAAAAAKSALLDLAATSLGVAEGEPDGDKGVVSGGGRTVTYGALLGGKLFNIRMPAATEPRRRRPGDEADRAVQDRRRSTASRASTSRPR